MTLDQLRTSKGENQIAGAVAWLEHQGVHTGFSLRARAFLEGGDGVKATENPQKVENTV